MSRNNQDLARWRTDLHYIQTLLGHESSKKNRDLHPRKQKISCKNNKFIRCDSNEEREE
jgi:hypothetical protein